MFGVKPRRLMIPFVNESMTPSMSVIIYSKSDAIGFIIPTY